MKQSQAKEYLPFVQAATEGKIIEWFNGDIWKEVGEEYSITGSEPHFLRIKPEPFLVANYYKCEFRPDGSVKLGGQNVPSNQIDEFIKRRAEAMAPVNASSPDPEWPKYYSYIPYPDESVFRVEKTGEVYLCDGESAIKLLHRTHLGLEEDVKYNCRKRLSRREALAIVGDNLDK